MKNTSLIVCGLVVMAALPELDAEDRSLFEFNEAREGRTWQAVNDGVMGGRSVGRFKINDEGRMEFFGTLSLENNGGFASVRVGGPRLGLHSGDVVLARVRGDGREYSLNLYTERELGGYSYRQTFATKNNEWIEVGLPVADFVATWRGRVVPDAKLDPSRVAGLGFLLGDGRAGPFKLEVDWIRVGGGQNTGSGLQVRCPGTYARHLQGVASDETAIYWCFTTELVKTDMKGDLLAAVPVADHHGDLCLYRDKLYVAVNLGEFNNPQGNADSWVYVYDTQALKELARHEVQEVFHGAGGIGVRDGHFFVVGGLPDGVEENYVYEYDETFLFLEKHTIASGHTHLGIQTATFAHNRWWFGCYGSPEVMLVTDADFRMPHRYQRNCSLGIEGFSGGRLLVASGRCEKVQGAQQCAGSVRTALPDEQAGFR